MIMAEVVFDGDKVWIDNHQICIEVSMCDVYTDYQYKESFDTLEQAIAYCLEQKK